MAIDEETAPEVGAWTWDPVWRRRESELAPLVERLRAARRAFGPRPADVGAWWITDAERETFRQLEERWNKLEAWGVRDKLVTPAHRASIGEWRDFSARWRNGDEEPRELSYQTGILTVVEGHAKELGYDKPAGNVAPPDPEKNAPPGFSAVSEFAKGLEAAGIPVPTANAPREAAAALQRGAEKAGKAWEGIPLTAKAAGGLVVLGGVIWGAERLAKRASEAARALEAARKRGGSK